MATLLTLPHRRLRAADKTNVQINSYVVDADLDPTSHHLTATVQVNFTALETADTLVFQLHNSLKVKQGHRRSTDAAIPASVDRTRPSASPPASRWTKGQTDAYTFQYDGELRRSRKTAAPSKA